MSDTTLPDISADELALAGLELSRDGAFLTVTLARPDARNAQTPQLWWTLASIGEWIAEADRGLKAVIFEAQGKSFSAGLDLRMLTPEGIEGQGSLIQWMSGAEGELDRQIERFQQAFGIWRELPVVVIAAVQGHAIGAGFQLALSADMIVCADDVQFCMKEPNLGLVPDLAGTKPLVDTVGYQRALEICLSGRYVLADEAVRLGIALESVPAESLAARVRELAESMTKILPGALSETKALLVEAGLRSHRDQQKVERTAQGRRMAELLKLMGGQ